MGWIDRSRPKGAKVQKSTRSKKIERLDIVFSKFIRRRDCSFTFGRCISCGKIIKFEDCDAGHYINRKHMAVRFDEHNVNAQCRSCNRFLEGFMQGYRRGLLIKIGEKALELLELKMYNTCKISETELDILIDYYKKKLKVIENEK